MKKVVVGALSLIGAVIAVPALAADMRMPVKAPMMAAPSWTGLYIGGNVGYGWGGDTGGRYTSFSDVDIGGYAAFFAAGGNVLPGVTPSGAIGGLQIGYDWQISSTLVFGLVADIQASGMKDFATAVAANLVGFNNNAQSNTASIDWFGTVRGRLGVLVSPSLLVYGTAGLAYGEVKANTFQSNPNNGLGPVTFAGSTSETNFGWAAGVGIDYALTSNWRVGVEYLHIDLDSVSVTARQASRFNAITLNTFTSTPDFSADIVRLTLNYKF